MLNEIKRAYPHRIEADWITCPVCCGDTITDDKRFGGKVFRINDEGTDYARTIYHCVACAVWAENERDLEIEQWDNNRRD